jgi:PKD repeat protein
MLLMLMLLVLFVSANLLAAHAQEGFATPTAHTGHQGTATPSQTFPIATGVPADRASMHSLLPSAEFDAWPQVGNAPFTTTFHIVEMANITGCSWNYGDGQTSTICTQVHDHTYNDDGTYTVSLTVTGTDGPDSMTRTDYIVVDSVAPSVSWIAPVSDEGVYEVGDQIVNLEVDANDNMNVSLVVFTRWDYINLDYVEIGTVNTFPYNIDFDTSTLLPEWNQIDVWVYDEAGNVTTTDF